MKLAKASPRTPRSLTSGARSIDSIRQAVLLRACADGDLSVVQVLIDVGANVNCADPEGMTPLHWACRRGALDMGFALLEAGAKIHAVSNDGSTPLRLVLATTSANAQELAALLRARGAVD